MRSLHFQIGSSHGGNRTYQTVVVGVVIRRITAQVNLIRIHLIVWQLDLDCHRALNIGWVVCPGTLVRSHRGTATTIVGDHADELRADRDAIRHLDVAGCIRSVVIHTDGNSGNTPSWHGVGVDHVL